MDTPNPNTQDTAAQALEKRARRRVALKKGWLAHALVFVLVNTGLWLVWQVADIGGGMAAHRHGFHAFRFWGWGLGLAIHGLVVLVKLHGEGLTERMVEREIAALKRREGRGA